jgi:hypothetical protein
MHLIDCRIPDPNGSPPPGIMQHRDFGMTTARGISRGLSGKTPWRRLQVEFVDLITIPLQKH